MRQPPRELLAAADTAGLTVEAVLHRHGKALLARGTLNGVPAAVKYLCDPDPFWAAKWRHEADIYRVFSQTPPPVRVPRLLYTDNERLLVLTWIDGVALADERYPRPPLTAREVDALLGCISALNGWTKATERLTPTLDYRERLTRYHAKGYLSDGDLRAVEGLLSDCGPADQVNHGDPLASNVLIDPKGDPVLLDWEFTGLFLPGFDLAMLHTLIGTGTPAVRERVEAIVDQTGNHAAFAVNLVTVLTRELRLHHELPEGPLRERRLPIIEAAWTAARERVHDLASRRRR